MTHYGVMTDYDYTATHKRERLTIWSGPFYSVFEGQAYTLPKRDGYMVGTYNGDRIRVSCPTPRTDDNWQQIDAAIGAALRAHYREQQSGDLCARAGCGLTIEQSADLPYCSTECSIDA